MKLSLTVVIVALGINALSSTSFAQLSDEQREATAQQLFERGHALYQQNQLQAAIDVFLESERIAPTPNIAFDIAQTYELIGRYDDAFNWYERARSYEDGDPAGANAEQRASALLDRVAVLEITVSPREAELAIDEHALEPTTRPKRRIALPPGEHLVTARAPGYEQNSTHVEALRGACIAVALSLAQSAGHLSVNSTPNGALVLRRPELAALGRTPLNLTVPSGELQLRLRLDGHEDQDATVHVVAENTTSIALTMRPRMLPTASAPVSAAKRAGAEPRRDQGLGSLRWIGYGAATALIGTGIGLGIAAIDRKQEVEADPRRRGRDDVDRLNLAADLTAGAGVLTAVVTFVLDYGLFGFGSDFAR